VQDAHAARFELAQALWDGQDRERARQLAEQSRDGYRGVEGEAKALAEVEAWLAERGG
jgi:hypothetical protein